MAWSQARLNRIRIDGPLSSGSARRWADGLTGRGEEGGAGGGRHRNGDRDPTETLSMPAVHRASGPVTPAAGSSAASRGRRAAVSGSQHESESAEAQGPDLSRLGPRPGPEGCDEAS